MKTGKRTSRMWTAAVISGVLTIGCAASIPPRVYVASATRLPPERVAETEEARKLVPFAGNLLEHGRATVGFVPPAWCSAVVPSDPPLLRYSKQQCAALVTTLEQTARKQGYTVVDSRRLLGNPQATDALDKVDALFYIEALTVHTAPEASVADIRLSEQRAAHKRAPLGPDTTTRLRCKTLFENRYRQERRFEDTVAGVAVSIKMASGDTAAPAWTYTYTAPGDTVPSETDELYFVSEGTKERAIGKLVLGPLFLGAGTAAAVIGARINENADSFAVRNAGFGLAWASVVPLAIGLPFTIIGLVKTLRSPNYPPATSVVCTETALDNSPMQEQPVREPPRPVAKTEAVQHFSTIIADRLFEQLGQLKDDRVEPPAPPVSSEEPPTSESGAIGAEAPQSTDTVPQPDREAGDQ